MDRGGKIGGFLEQPNGGGPSGSRGIARSNIFERDATDGDHGNAYGATNLAQAFDTLWRAVERFRRRVKNWAEVNIVRAVACSAESRAKGVTGNADEEIEAFAGILFETGTKAARVRNGKTIFTEVNAARSGGESDVDAVVDKNARVGRAGANGLQGRAREIERFPAAQILFAQLNPVHSGAGRGLHSLQKHGNGVRGNRKGKAAAIGHIANDGFRVPSGEGHGMDLSWIESS